MENVIVVAPHPDDETLGCGGTLLKHKKKGDNIYWLIMTGMPSKVEYSAERIRTRQREIGAVKAAYGFKETFTLDLPATKLDTISKSEAVKLVSDIINKVKPSYVYLPYKNDIHSDHRLTFDTVLSSAKTFRAPSIKKMFMYEVISETEFSPPLKDSVFIPNSFSDITAQIDGKIKIMKIYKGEMDAHPFPRSAKNIKALATFRGATAGVKYAEAFMVLKEVW